MHWSDPSDAGRKLQAPKLPFEAAKELIRIGNTVEIQSRCEFRDHAPHGLPQQGRAFHGLETEQEFSSDVRSN